METEGFDFPIQCGRKLPTRTETMCVRLRGQRFPRLKHFSPPIDSWRESSVLASIWFKCGVHLDGCQDSRGRSLPGLGLGAVPASRTTESWVGGPVRARRPSEPGFKLRFSRAVTSFLLLSFPPLLGRTGLLADLLPSFAVEIMPGIRSFNSSFASFAVAPSVLLLH